MPRHKPTPQPQPRRNVADRYQTYRRDSVSAVKPVLPHEPERVDDQRDEEEDVERLVREGDLA